MLDCCIIGLSGAGQLGVKNAAGEVEPGVVPEDDGEGELVDSLPFATVVGIFKRGGGGNGRIALFLGFEERNSDEVITVRDEETLREEEKKTATEQI